MRRLVVLPSEAVGWLGSGATANESFHRHIQRPFGAVEMRDETCWENFVISGEAAEKNTSGRRVRELLAEALCCKNSQYLASGLRQFKNHHYFRHER